MILAGSDLSERNNYPCNKIMNIDDSVLDTSCGMGRSQKFAEATKVLRPIVFTESASTGDSHGADRCDSKNWPPLTDHDYSNLPVASKSNISEPPRQVCRDLNSILLSNNTNLSEASSLFNASTWPSMPRPTSPGILPPKQVSGNPFSRPQHHHQQQERPSIYSGKKKQNHQQLEKQHGQTYNQHQQQHRHHHRRDILSPYIEKGHIDESRTSGSLRQATFDGDLLRINQACTRPSTSLSLNSSHVYANRITLFPGNTGDELPLTSVRKSLPPTATREDKQKLLNQRNCSPVYSPSSRHHNRHTRVVRHDQTFSTIKDSPTLSVFLPSSELADLSPHEAIMYARIMRQYKQPRTAQNLKRQQAQNSPLSQSNSLRQQILPQTFQVEHINQLGISIKGQDLRSAHSIVATRSRPPYQQQLQRHPTYANTSPLTVDSFSSGGVNDTTLLLDKASLKPRLSSAQQNEPGTNLRQTHSRSFLQSEQRQPQSYQLTRK